MIPTDEKIAHNIVKEVSTIPNLLEYEAMTLCATKMAQRKNEQYKKEKQQLIKKANEAVNQGFENGAKFMKQQLIDKAADWLRMTMNFFNNGEFNTEKFVDDFKEVMEEEI